MFLLSGAAGFSCVDISGEKFQSVLTLDSTRRYLSFSFDEYPAIDFTIEFFARTRNDDESDAGLVRNPGRLGGLWNQHFVIAPLNLGEGRRSPGISMGKNSMSLYEMRDGEFQSVIFIEKNFEDWHHLAIVYSENQPAIYIDGKLFKGGRPSSDTVFAAVEIGHVFAKNLPFEGMVDEFRIWNRALHAEEISGIFEGNRDAGRPFLHYNFEDMDDHLLVFDRSGNGRHASVVLSEPLFGFNLRPDQVPPERDIPELADLHPGTGGNEIIQHLDYFKQGRDGTSLEGWAFTANIQDENQQVFFFLEGLNDSFLLKPIAFKRTDVVRKFPEANQTCGFFSFIPNELTPNPPYSLSLMIFANGKYSGRVKPEEAVIR